VAPLARIVSGGQTGADRAALDVAVVLGIPYGGWCPRGGWAEDLREPPGLLARYPSLQQTPEAEPSQRTRWNVRDSDATLVLLDGPSPPERSGTALTVAVARELNRPLALAELADPEAALGAAHALLRGLGDGAVLNVAGPRESRAPGIYERSRGFLLELLGG